MKVTKQIPVAKKDGTKFPLQIEIKDQVYMKLCGNKERALYSIRIPKTEKLVGFAIMSQKDKRPRRIKSIMEVNFAVFQTA